MPTVRPLAAHEWPAYRDLRIRALADAPDAFGTTLDDALVRREADWIERLAAGVASEWELPLVAQEGDDLIGLAWGTINPSAPETAYVLQMWVAPRGRGLGCGAMLLGAIVAWARKASARSVMLSVTCGNSPATRLYLGAGFHPVGDPEPLRTGSSLLAQPMRLDL